MNFRFKSCKLGNISDKQAVGAVYVQKSGIYIKIMNCEIYSDSDFQDQIYLKVDEAIMVSYN